MKQKSILFLVAVCSFAGSVEAWGQTDEEIAQASVEHPLDMSSRIVNPSFDGGDVTTGWEGTAFKTVGGKALAQHTGCFYKTYQTLTNLPKGVYAVGVKAFYRPGSVSEAYSRYQIQEETLHMAVLYANSKSGFKHVGLKSIYDDGQEKKQAVGAETSFRDIEDNKIKYMPANLAAADHYFHELGAYDNTLVIGFVDDSLTIGVDKSSFYIDGDWSVFDDFSLTYYGTGDDAARVWRNQVLSEHDTDAEYQVSPVAWDRYLKAVNTLRAAIAFEDVSAAVSALGKAHDDLVKNERLWSSLKYFAEEYDVRAKSGSFDDEASQAMLAVIAEVNAAIEAMTMDNDEQDSLYDRLMDAYDDMMKKPKDGADMTFLLEDPGFENFGGGWYFNYSGTGNVGVAGTNENLCFEAWNCPSFDIHQYIYDAPLGVYEVQVQGFYRYLRDTPSWTAYKNQRVNYVKPGGAPVYVYINDSKTPLMNIFDEKVPAGDYYVTDPSLLYPDNLPPTYDDEGYWYPNEMYNSAIAFSNGLYKQSAFGVVASEYSIMDVGIVGKTNQGGDSWAIWDNFRLIYHGYKADVVKPVLEETIAEAQRLFALLMGRSEHAGLTSAVNEAVKALETDDGETMFNALADLYPVMSLATESCILFAEAEMEHPVADLVSVVSEYEMKPIEKAVIEKGKLLSQQIADCSLYENEDLDKMRKDISDMINQILLSGAAYEQLGNALNQLSIALTAATEVIGDDSQVSEAKKVYVDALAHYSAGQYDNEAASAKIDELKELTDRLNSLTMGVAGIVADGSTIEFYTVDGRRIERAVKGVVVMKMTRADGSVLVRKLNMK